MNYWDEIHKAIRAHRDAQAAIQVSASSMSALLVGNLRYCSHYTLKKLKEELRDYNIHTGSWKSPK